MLARLTASAVFGVDAIPVSVEVDVSPGLPGLTVVGLPDTTVRESRDRVRTAIRNAGFPFPTSRVTVSLAPADVRKVGAAFDLPIALGVLAAAGTLPHCEPLRFSVVGGLSLDGGVPPMRGLLPIAVAALRIGAGLVFPAANLAEAAIVEGLHLFPVRSLMDAARIVSAPDPQPSPPPPDRPADPMPEPVDLADVRGQLLGRRAIEIAAAGAHHLLFSGPPGAGKTMLARRLPGLLPPLEFDEALAVTTIHSVAGFVPPGGGLIRRRPFRAPHHTCSDVALVGGGSHPRPGELSLAHGGVLFLDELPEFQPQALDSLRQPLETGEVLVARANHRAVYPARFQLVAAMNPCRCGHALDPGYACRRQPNERCAAQYQARLSGPLIDRFDLRIEVPAVSAADLVLPPPSEGSREVAARVAAARARQSARYEALGLRGCATNAAAPAAAIERASRLDAGGTALIREASDRFALTARGFHRVLKLARTIADLDGSESVSRRHLAEALSYRAGLSGQRLAA